MAVTDLLQIRLRGQSISALSSLLLLFPASLLNASAYVAVMLQFGRWNFALVRFEHARSSYKYDDNAEYKLFPIEYHFQIDWS